MQNSTPPLETCTQAKFEFIDPGTPSVLLFPRDFAKAIHSTWDAQVKKSDPIISALKCNVFLLSLALLEIISLHCRYSLWHFINSCLAQMPFYCDLYIFTQHKALSVFIGLNLLTWWSKPLALKFGSTLNSLRELTKVLRPKSHW